MKRYVALLVALGLLVCVPLARSLRRSRPDSPMQQLADAHVGRAFKPRLSIPTEYRRCTPVPAARGETVPRESCGDDEDAALDANAFASAAESTSPDSLQASALAEV